MRVNPLLALLTPLLAAGCATPAPYAEVTGEGSSRSDPFEEDALILAVDEQLYLTSPKKVMIDPGQRQVVLGTSRLDRRGEASNTVVPLNAKACLRYHFVARHESMSRVQPWKLVLKDVQPIPECVSRHPEHAPVPGSTPPKPES